MQVFLELSGHPKANVRRVLVSRTTLIGRSRECALQIASPSVSRKHCELRVGDEGVSVIDLGSSNGTFIDADRLTPGESRPLPSGARLNVGGVRFVVTYSASAPVSAVDSPTTTAVAGLTDAAAVPAKAEKPAVRDEPILPEESIFPEEPILADEPILPDEPIVAEEPVAAPAAKTAAAPMIDDEPDLSAMFADEPEPAATPAASTPADDEPILGSDEEDAFAFLTDDEEESPVAGGSRPGLGG